MKPGFYLATDVFAAAAILMMAFYVLREIIIRSATNAS